jgi:small subunit ribosomal protein S20
MREAVKGAQAGAGKSREAQNEVLKKAYAAIDKAAKRGVIKKNTASRKKARLAKFLKTHTAK